MISRFAALVGFAPLIWLAPVLCAGQQPSPNPAPPGSQPPTAAPATTPASATATESQPAIGPTVSPDGRVLVKTRVIEVRGDVEVAPLDSDDWKPVKLGDQLNELSRLRTGVHSGAKLQMGAEEPFTAVAVDSSTQLIIAEAFRTAEKKRVRLGVGYGQIRAGVAEGGLQSDFTVDSPVATLSKRGTWNFGLAYERGTDRFDVFLLDRGLVQALSKVTGQQREVIPGEKVTQAMLFFLDQAQRDRNVSVNDVLGQTSIDVAFNRLQNDGLGVLGPGQGRWVYVDLSNSTAQAQFAELVQTTLGTIPFTPPISPIGVVSRPEAFFGTGGGDALVKVIIDRNSSLAKGGFARPGEYQIRRSALEGWMRGRGK